MSIIKPHISAMSAYKPPLEGRNPKAYTLLDFNERTVPVSQPIIDALQAFIGDGRLQQYPAYGDIVERLADYAEVTSHQVMITNGSDQGIDLIFRAVAKTKAEAIIPAPTFAMYQQCANVEARGRAGGLKAQVPSSESTEEMYALAPEVMLTLC